MNEIKFRVWDRIRNCWLNGDKTIISSSGIFRFNLPPEEYFIMLSSGLRDKNGIDIYEGDIIKFSHSGGLFYTVGEIYYDTYSLKIRNERYFWQNPPADHFDNVGFYRDWDREIVGNVFENSELLNS